MQIVQTALILLALTLLGSIPDPESWQHFHSNLAFFILMFGSPILMLLTLKKPDLEQSKKRALGLSRLHLLLWLFLYSFMRGDYGLVCGLILFSGLPAQRAWLGFATEAFTRPGYKKAYALRRAFGALLLSLLCLGLVATIMDVLFYVFYEFAGVLPVVG